MFRSMRKVSDPVTIFKRLPAMMKGCTRSQATKYRFRATAASCSLWRTMMHSSITSSRLGDRQRSPRLARATHARTSSCTLVRLELHAFEGKCVETYRAASCDMHLRFEFDAFAAADFANEAFHRNDHALLELPGITLLEIRM